jgi:hypothetical protein
VTRLAVVKLSYTGNSGQTREEDAASVRECTGTLWANSQVEVRRGTRLAREEDVASVYGYTGRLVHCEQTAKLSGGGGRV